MEETPVPTNCFRAEIYKNDTITVYGSKQTQFLKKKRDIKKDKKHPAKVSKSGYGWSGVSPSADEDCFFVVSDNYSKSIFKINFETGAAEKLKLKRHHVDLESVAPAPGLYSDGEALIIACSSSLNKTGSSSHKTRNRISVARLSDNESHIHLSTWPHVRDQLLEKLKEQSELSNDDENYLDVDMDPEKSAKHNGLDIEGIAFVPASSFPDPDNAFHLLLLGLRGPITKDKEAILVPVHIPVETFEDTSLWEIKPAFSVPFAGGHSCRDCFFDLGSKTVLILAGPYWQDKKETGCKGYIVYGLDPFDISHRITKRAVIPRIPNSEIDHSNVPSSNVLEGKTVEVQDKEKGSSFTSPEGICRFRDKLLVCWDNNDVGPYAVVDFPHKDKTQDIDELISHWDFSH